MHVPLRRRHTEAVDPPAVLGSRRLGCNTGEEHAALGVRARANASCEGLDKLALMEPHSWWAVCSFFHPEGLRFWYVGCGGPPGCPSSSVAGSHGPSRIGSLAPAVRCVPEKKNPINLDSFWLAEAPGE